MAEIKDGNEMVELSQFMVALIVSQYAQFDEDGDLVTDAEAYNSIIVEATPVGVVNQERDTNSTRVPMREILHGDDTKPMYEIVVSDDSGEQTRHLIHTEEMYNWYMSVFESAKIIHSGKIGD